MRRNMQRYELDIKFVLVLTTFLLVMIVSASAFASDQHPLIQLTPEEQAYLDEKKQLSFVYDPDWPPYEYIDENDQYVGIAADYLQFFSEGLGIPLQRIPTRSWLESVAIAKSGRSDFVSMLNKTPDRERFLDFTKPYFHSQTVIIGKDEIWLEHGLADISDKTIAVVDGYWFTSILRDKYPQTPMLRTQSVREALLAVKSGKAYAVVTTVIEASYQIRHNHLSDLHIIGETPYSYKLCIGVRKNDPLLLSIMQKAVDSLTDVHREQIRVKWLSDDVKELPVNYTMPLLLGGFLLLVLLAGFYLYRKIY